MVDLPNKSGEPILTVQAKNIQPVVPEGAVNRAARPATRRFFNFMFEASPKDLGKEIGRNVIVPRIKLGMEEALNSFISGMFWGNGANKPISGMVKGTVLRGSASTYHNAQNQPSALMQARESVQPNPKSSGNYEDVVCDTQQRAEAILAGAYELLNMYRVICVADLYELARIEPAPSDGSYGWMSLDGARISKVRDGFLLELPRPTLL